MLGMGKLAYLRIKVIMIVAILIVGFSSMSAIPISLPPAYAQTTFGSIVNLSQNSGSSFNAQVATLGNNVYAVWFDNTPGNFEIFFRKSTDGGATFGSAVNLTINPASSSNPSIAVAQVGANTNVYIAYHEVPLGGTGFDAEVMLLRSTDDGANFGAPVNISNTLGIASTAPNVAAAGNFVFVAWAENPPPGFPNSDIFLRRSIDAGVTFQLTQQISNTPFFSFSQHIALNLPNVHIAWNDNGNSGIAVGGDGETLYRRSTDNGASYGPVVNLSSNIDFSFGSDIAVSGSNVHVVWAEHTSANVPTQVAYKRSTDDGTNFGATTTLLPLSGLGGAVTAFTGIAATGSNVFVVFNEVIVVGGNQEIFFKRSTNNGVSFSSAVNLSNNSGESNFADIAVSSVHVTWHDNTPINFDIFTTTGATGAQVTGSVTIAGTCGLAPVSGSPINYGTLTPFSISPEQTLVLDNTGSVNATLSVKGTDWLASDLTVQMNVTSTKYSLASGTYASKIALTKLDTIVGPISATTNLDTFWQLQANLLSSSFAGSLTQTMDFTVSC